MLPTKQDQHDKPTTEVKGGFPVTFHYTAGIAMEKFYYGLKDQKLLANTCDHCDFTYLPPRFFCEDCFAELGDENYQEVGPSGELLSFSEVFVDKRGDLLDSPYFVGLIKVEGTNTKFFHRLVNIDKPEIGMTVKAVWEDDRSGSYLDLKGFTS